MAFTPSAVPLDWKMDRQIPKLRFIWFDFPKQETGLQPLSQISQPRIRSVVTDANGTAILKQMHLANKSSRP